MSRAPGDIEVTSVKPGRGAKKRAKQQKGDLIPAALTGSGQLARVRFYGERDAVRYAGFWFRFWARVVDGFLYGLIIAAIEALGIWVAYLAREPGNCRVVTPIGTHRYRYCYADGWGLTAIILVTSLAVGVVIWFGLIYPVGKTGLSVGRRARRIRVMDRFTHSPIGIGAAFWRFAVPLIVAVIPAAVRWGAPAVARWVFSSPADIAYYEDLFGDWSVILAVVAGGVLVLGVAWMFVDKSRQTLWDKVAGSIVVQEPPAVYR